MSGGGQTDTPGAYRGPYPFREGITCADFNGDGELVSRPQVHPGGQYTAEIGQAMVDVFHNGYFWVMRFAEGRAHNRLMLGQDLRQIARLRDAFERALFGFHGLGRRVMVGGVEFGAVEARQMRDLLALVLIERSVNG